MQDHLRISSYKQNRESTKGLFEVKSRLKHCKFEVSGLSNCSTSKSEIGGRNQVSRRVGVPCWHAYLLQMLHGTTHNSMKTMKLVESLNGWEVIVSQGSEWHLTFVRGILHIAE